MKHIVRMLAGSHLHGLATNQSDHDYRSVFLPSSYQILTGTAKSSYVVNKATLVDETALTLADYLRALSKGDIQSVEMLFAAKPIATSPEWKNIVRVSKQNVSAASFISFVKSMNNRVTEAFEHYTTTDLTKRVPFGSRVNGFVLDGKTLAHFVRIRTEAQELIESESITFPLVNREYLLNLKQSPLTLDVVEAILKETTDFLDSVKNYEPPKVYGEPFESLLYDLYREHVLAEEVPDYETF